MDFQVLVELLSDRRLCSSVFIGFSCDIKSHHVLDIRKTELMSSDLARENIIKTCTK